MKVAIYAALLAVMLFMVCGCAMMPRFIYPIQTSELAPAAQQALAAKDTIITAKDAEIAKLRAHKPTSLAPFYYASAALIVGGVVAYAFTKLLGVLGFTGGGALLFGTVYAFDKYPWLLLIPAAMIFAVLAYCLYLFVRALKAQKDLAKVVPAIEKLDDTTKATVKAAISTEAKGAKLAAVSAIKEALKLGKEKA